MVKIHYLNFFDLYDRWVKVSFIQSEGKSRSDIYYYSLFVH